MAIGCIVLAVDLIPMEIGKAYFGADLVMYISTSGFRVGISRGYDLDVTG